MADPDINRKVAHQRYANAARVASEAGSDTQAGLLAAYKNLYGKDGSTDWIPEEGWAENYQYGVPASISEETRALAYQQDEQPPTAYRQGAQQQTGSAGSDSYLYQAPQQYREQESGADRTMGNQASLSVDNAISPSLSGYEAAVAPQQADDETKEAGRSIASASSNKIEIPRLSYDWNSTIPDEDEIAAAQAARNRSAVVSENIADSVLDQVGRIFNTELRPGITRERELSKLDPDEVARQVEEERRRKQEIARDLAYNQLVSQYTMSGANPYSDPYFQQNVDAIENMEETPWLMGEMLRRFYNEDASMKNPWEYNLVGISSQNKSSDAVRNLYDLGFMNDASRPEKPYIPEDNQVIDRTLIDDGWSPISREGIYMTGDQYIKYRTEYGIPGRDIDKIIPGKLYSKQDEMVEHGFLPYLVSDEGLDEFHNHASAQQVNSAFNRLADFRRDNLDFDLNIDGKSHSGLDFIKKMNDKGDVLRDQYQAAIQNPDLSTGMALEKQSDYDVPYSGQINKKTGEFVPYADYEDGWMNEDGSVEILWPDGTTWRFDSEDDAMENMRYQLTDNPDEAVIWLAMDPDAVKGAVDSVKLDDGTMVDGITAMKLMGQISEGEGENVDFGPFSMSQPVVRLPNLDAGEIADWFSKGKYLPWFTDLVLGSAPYFSMPVGFSMGSMRGFEQGSGFNPKRDDYNGTYSMVSEDPSIEKALSEAVGSTIMPATEHLWGPLGSSMLGKLPILKGRIGDEAMKAWSPKKRWAAGMLGEGLEEIPGNITEELSNNGFFDWYKNRKPNEYDSQGNPVFEDTDWLQRINNFASDIPEAVIGGAAMGGVLGLPRIPEYKLEHDFYKALLDEYGDIIEPGSYAPVETRGLTDEERAYYNR